MPSLRRRVFRLHRQRRLHAGITRTVHRIEQPERVAMLFQELPSQTEEDVAERFALEKAAEEPLCPDGGEKRRCPALRTDDTARTLCDEIRHETVVEQGRELR